MTWRLVPHTADVAIEADGPDEGACLAEAATALSSVITDRDPRLFVPDHEIQVTLEAPDDEALLVAWLSELLWLLESEDRLWITGGCTVEATADGRRVRATGNAVRYDPTLHGQGTEVKAVTYHEVRSAAVKGQWGLRVVLDI